MGNGAWDHMGNSMGWGMGFGGIFMILFWVVIIVGVVVLARWLLGDLGQNDKAGGKSALDVLKERYASGAIDREEFEQKRRDIG